MIVFKIHLREVYIACKIIYLMTKLYRNYY